MSVSATRVSGTSAPGAARAVCLAGLFAALLAGPLAGPLVGCTLRAPESPAAVVPTGPDPAETLVPETRLVEAAERAERALARLARTLPAPDRGTPWYGGTPRYRGTPWYPASAMPAMDSVPATLRRLVTIDWTGPLEGLVHALAKHAGYRFLAAGRPPARPLIVAVEADGEPLLAVLRDAGLRAGSAAVLTVDAAAETVLLDWTGSAPSRAPGEDG